MRFKKVGLMLVSTVLVLSSNTVFAKYSGVGGMTKHKIKSKVYKYHYDNGFTGIDALGWDSNLQYAWSRTGAALTCNIEIDKQLILKKMTEKYGQFDFIHDVNGVGFHHLHSKKVKKFCTEERVKEILEVIPKFEVGDFPELFDVKK